MAEPTLIEYLQIAADDIDNFAGILEHSMSARQQLRERMLEAIAALCADDEEIARLTLEHAEAAHECLHLSKLKDEAQDALAQVRRMVHDIVSAALGLKDHPDHGATVFLRKDEIEELMVACSYVPALARATEGK